MQTVEMDSREATITLGKAIGARLAAGDVLVLDGDLGAGKTTFTKGLAQGLAIPDIIKSPTFTIIHEYHDGRLPLTTWMPTAWKTVVAKTWVWKNTLTAMGSVLLNGLNLLRMNCQTTF